MLKVRKLPAAIIAAWLMHHYGGWAKPFDVASAASLPSIIKEALPPEQPKFGRAIRETMERAEARRAQPVADKLMRLTHQAFACRDQNEMALVDRISRTDDAVAFTKLFEQLRAKGQCTVFAQGAELYVGASHPWLDLYRVRLKGDTNEYWIPFVFIMTAR